MQETKDALILDIADLRVTKHIDVSQNQSH